MSSLIKEVCNEYCKSSFEKVCRSKSMIEDSEVIYFKNHGNGKFHEQPQVIQTISRAFEKDDIGDILSVDVDSDGTLDLIVQTRSKIMWLENVKNNRSLWISHEIGQVKYPILIGNIGDPGNVAGHYSEFMYSIRGDKYLVENILPRTSILVAGDIDNDGKIDILSAAGYDGIVLFKSVDSKGTNWLSTSISISCASYGRCYDPDANDNLGNYHYPYRITSIFLVDFDGDGRTDILESSEPPNLESKRYSPAKWYRNANSDDNANTLSHFEMLEFGRFTREGYFNDRNDGKFIIAGTFDGDASINVLVVGHNNNIFSLKSFKSNDLIIRKKEQITSLFGVEVYQQDPQSSFSGAATCREYNKFAINVPPHSIISTRRNEPYFKAGYMLSSFFTGVNLFAWSNFDSDNLIDAIFYQITGPGAKINISHSTPQGNI